MAQSAALKSWLVFSMTIIILRNLSEKKHLGECLWLQIKEHPLAALRSENKSFDFYVGETYKALLEYPQHIDVKKWFDNTRTIAKYEVMKVRGTRCTAGTSNSEATHQSNEAHIPMKLMRMMSPEEQLLKLTHRSDQ